MLGERTYSMCGLFPRLTLAGERIQETHSGRCNIVDIACDQGPVMYQCSCRHQAVNHRQRVRDIETPPCLGHTGGDRDNAVTVGMTEMGIASRRESTGVPATPPRCRTRLSASHRKRILEIQVQPDLQAGLWPS